MEVKIGTDNGESNPRDLAHIIAEEVRRVVREELANAGKAPDGLLSKTELGAFLGVSERSVERLVDQGEIVPIEVTGVLRFTRDGIDRYLRRNAKQRVRKAR